MSQTVISLGLVFATFALYIFIALRTRAKNVGEFYVSGRTISAPVNGMAVAADWMSAASFTGMAGAVMLGGYDGLAYIMGWTGGYVLLALFLAPQLRKFGRFTVPEFIGDRYESHGARLLAILATVVVSFTYVLGQMKGSGIVMAQIFNVDYRIGIFIAIALIILYATLGGMKGITWAQVAQYWVLIIAYLIPVTVMSLQYFGIPLPWLTYGSALDQMAAVEAQMNIKAYTQPFTNTNMVDFLALTFVLMVGTAGLPHVIVRFYTVPTMKAARWSAAWALLFIGLLYLSAPAYAAFVRYALMNQVVGQPINALPDWTAQWTKIGLLKIQDGNADGILQWAEMTVGADMVVLAGPQIAGLGSFVIGLVAAGAVAAALSTAGGLLMAISSAFSHDLYVSLINPNADEKKKLAVGRWAIAITTLVAGLISINPPGIIVQMVAWAFSLAAGSFFPVLVLGAWWPRATRKGAIAGMIVGLSVTIAYIVAAKWGGFKLFGIGDRAAGIFGMPLNFLVTYLVSLYADKPSEQMQQAVSDLRYPEELTMLPAGGDD